MVMANEPAVIQETAIDRMENFHTYMLRRAKEEEKQGDLAQEISAHKADQIFAAETEDDIWAAGAGGTVQGRDAIGLELAFHSFRPSVSTKTFDRDDDGKPDKGYYITADVTVLGGPDELLRKLGLSIGEQVAFQTGADDIIYRLRAFELRGILTENNPVKGLIAATKTTAGNNVLFLRKLPARATAGQTA